jgi:anti-sigma factor RsiW
MPDLAASGYRFMGGRIVATAQGPAALFMYDDDRGTRLVMLARPMAADQNQPMTRSNGTRSTAFVGPTTGSVTESSEASSRRRSAPSPTRCDNS